MSNFWNDDLKGEIFSSSTTSTNSSCQLDGSAGLHVASAATDFVHKSEEMRLREHICQLKTIQATIQGTVVDLEPFHNSSSKANKNHHQMNRSQDQEQLETAVLKQELMAAKEEIADLKAKIYVSDKEKSGTYAHLWPIICFRTKKNEGHTVHIFSKRVGSIITFSPIWYCL